MNLTAVRRTRPAYVLTLVVPLLGIGLAGRARAQVATSTAKSIQLIAIKRASIGINLSSAAPVVFDLSGDFSTGSQAPAWSINWNLPAQAQLVRTCISLAGPLTGSEGSTHAIPPERVEARAESGGRFKSLSGAGCGRPLTLEVSDTYISSQNNKNGSRKDSVVLRIDNRGLNLPADNYVGTLNIFVEVIEAPHRTE